jgi:molybdopterin-guanine dinucleotide biosynthesis protein B
MKVLGISGWSGSGKTVLITRLIPLLMARGLQVATIKHAHHAFDIDVPGKDSFEHRAAGASEVIISSARRSAQIKELRGAPEPRLTDLLRRLSPCDLVLVEGFKGDAHPKLEVFRSATGRSPLHPTDASVVAIASDDAFPEAGLPWAQIDDIEGIAELVMEHARTVGEVLGRLEPDGATQ